MGRSYGVNKISNKSNDPGQQTKKTTSNLVLPNEELAKQENTVCVGIVSPTPSKMTWTPFNWNTRTQGGDGVNLASCRGNTSNC